MPLNDKIWRLIPPSPHASQLAYETGISPLNAQLLLNRGILDSSSARSFLSPRLSDVPDPMLLKDMDKAVDLIMRAIESRKKIAVFGDYDADGLCAAALLVNFFSALGLNISCYIPNRLDEGYSLNPMAIKKLEKMGVKLIITVDCGISNKKEIELARDLGIQIVVTDHHQIPEDFNPKCPVLNPNRVDSLFPFNGLAGVGVAFFLAVGLRAALRDRNWFKESPEPDLRQYLDLVALGTVADMVPLTGLNRILACSGIEVMKKSKWPGIEALKAISGMDAHETSSYDLAFRLAPRLNAPGRMGDIETGLRALTTDDEAIAMETAHWLNDINRRRQVIEGDILNDIEDTIIPEYNLKYRRTMVFARDGWHKGVLGIVASRLSDKYHRPSLVLTIRDGVATGSGRSIEGFDLYNAMTRLGSLFERFGGHYHAAGFTMDASKIGQLENGLEKIAQEKLNEEDLVPAIEIDSEIRLSELTFSTVQGLRSLQPFGKRNPEPLFYSEGLTVINSRVVGEKHLKLRISQEESTVEAIGFGLSDVHPLEGKTINMVFTPEINQWNGYERVQLRIKDLELSDGSSKLVRMKQEETAVTKKGNPD